MRSPGDRTVTFASHVTAPAVRVESASFPRHLSSITTPHLAPAGPLHSITPSVRGALSPLAGTGSPRAANSVPKGTSAAASQAAPCRTVTKSALTPMPHLGLCVPDVQVTTRALGCRVSALTQPEDLARPSSSAPATAGPTRSVLHKQNAVGSCVLTLPLRRLSS